MGEGGWLQVLGHGDGRGRADLIFSKYKVLSLIEAILCDQKTV